MAIVENRSRLASRIALDRLGIDRFGGATKSSPPAWSTLQWLVFFYGLFFVCEQAHRFYLAWLAPSALSHMPMLARAFAVGMPRDAAVAAGCVAGALLLAAPFTIRHGIRGHKGRRAVGLVTIGFLFAGLLWLLLLLDGVYFHYMRHHLDFVFFEYFDDLLTAASQPVQHSQAEQQLSAELDEGAKWVVPVLAFFGTQVSAAAAWWLLFQRLLAPRLLTIQAWAPRAAPLGIAGFLLIGPAGLDAVGMSPAPPIEQLDATIELLSQNAVLAAATPLSMITIDRWHWTPARPAQRLTLQEATGATQELIGDGRLIFDSPDYPVVHRVAATPGLRLARPHNIILLFVEGLDRRYIGQAVPVAGDAEAPIPVTPFLNRWRNESFYFDRFVSNGVQTSRGIFSTLCSFYPRHGTAVTKTREDRRLLCLPDVLRRAGYHTEMVTAQPGRINNLRRFLTRNGIERFIDQDDAPGEHLGIGLTDDALFDTVHDRIAALQSEGRPFFISALTVSTHHPFVFPQREPDVRRLARERDRYPAALRYTDGALDAFVGRLRREGLLDHSILVILGDHGRHEAVGETDLERRAGHFLSALFVWIDDLPAGGQSPATVSTVASQVDLTPTLLGLNGLMPDRVPFVGRDLSCVFVTACTDEHVAYLSDVYDDAVGLADRDGLWLLSLGNDRLERIGWDGTDSGDDPAAASGPRRHDILSVYLASNILIEEDRIWPSPPGAPSF